MRQHSLDLFGLMLLAAAALLAVLLGVESTLLRILLVVPLALYGMGYALGMAFYPRQPYGAAERFMLSLGLSLSALVLGGLLLHFLPTGLAPEAWAVLIFWITVGASLIALYRRWGADWIGGVLGRISSPAQALHTFNAGLSKTGPVGVGFLAAALLLVFASVGLARQPAPQEAYDGYSMLWLVPDQVGSGAQLGVRSMEFESRTYRVDLISGETVLQIWENLTLQPRQEWTTDVDLSSLPQGGVVEARLFRLDQPETVYRQTRLWLDVASRAPAAPEAAPLEAEEAEADTP
jgi:uncharacterized membrane protein